jgi:hypothetical protein
MAAQAAENLEAEQKGERFTLIEPPLVPEEPSSPNRPLVLGLGLLLALGSAIGLPLLLEAVDGRVRGRRDLQELVSMPPLAVIPWMRTEEERITRRRHWRLGLAATVAAGVTGLLLLNFLWRPLDVVWIVLLRRLGL